MVKKILVLTLVLLAVVVTSYSASASLIPMSWGFPVLVQNNSQTALQSQMQQASDDQSANIAFPTTTGGIIGTAFPTIGQVSNQNALATNLLYQNAKQSTYFAYPFLSIGGSPLASMGFM